MASNYQIIDRMDKGEEMKDKELRKKVDKLQEELWALKTRETDNRIITSDKGCEIFPKIESIIWRPYQSNYELTANDIFHTLYYLFQYLEIEISPEKTCGPRIIKKKGKNVQT